MLAEWWCEVKGNNAFVGLCVCGCLCTFKDVPEVENQVLRSKTEWTPIKKRGYTHFCLFQVGCSGSRLDLTCLFVLTKLWQMGGYIVWLSVCCLLRLCLELSRQAWSCDLSSLFSPEEKRVESLLTNVAVKANFWKLRIITYCNEVSRGWTTDSASPHHAKLGWFFWDFDSTGSISSFCSYLIMNDWMTFLHVFYWELQHTVG